MSGDLIGARGHMTGLSILFVGQMVPGARTGQRVAAFQRLGCDVTIVETNGPGATYGCAEF